MGLSYLITYTIIILLITFISFKNKFNAIYCVIWMEYAVSAVFCVICKIYQTVILGTGNMLSIWYNLDDTTMFGYILLLVCNLIAFEPIRIFNTKNELSKFVTRNKRNFFVIYSLLYIIFTFIFIIFSYGNIVPVFNVSDFGDLRNSVTNSDNEVTAQLAGNFLANFCMKLCLQFKGVSIFVVMGMLKIRNNPILSILLFVCTIFLVCVSTIAVAGRAGFIIFTLYVIVICMMFYKYLPSTSKFKILICGTVFLVVILLYFFVITISRLVHGTGDGSVEALFSNIAFYFGHGPIEFSKITGSLTDFAYGKTVLGRVISNFMGTPYSWEKIAYSIGYPEIGPVYNTYLGYLYTDFGSIGCLSYTFIWSYFVYKKIKLRPLHISTCYLFSYYIYYYLMGNFVIGRMEYVRVITTIFIYCIIRVIERSPELKRIFTSKLVFRE